MKLRGVNVSEAIRRFLYRSRLAKIAWEAFPVVSLILSSIWHVGRDVYQTDDGWIRARFSNYRSTIAVAYKNARSILKSKDALGGGDIVFEGRLRFLHNADVVSILNKNVVDAFPARTIRPGAVNQDNIPNAMVFLALVLREKALREKALRERVLREKFLRRERAASQQ
jgi:hypothetical protein